MRGGSAAPPDIERVALIGWAVYPCSRTSKAGCFAGAAAAASTDLDQIERWARDYPGCNWRVVCGRSKVFALDVDKPGTHTADGFAALAGLVEQHGALPPRPMTRTGGSAGAALFFAHHGEPLRGKSGVPAPGLDPHRGNQAVVIPPSRHPVTGGAYTWRVPPWEVAPPPIPAWLATLLAPPPPPVWRQPPQPSSERARNALMRAMHAVMDAPPGTANDTLNRRSYALGSWCAAGLLTETEAQASLYHAAMQRRIPGREAIATISSGLRAGSRKPMQAANAG